MQGSVLQDTGLFGPAKQLKGISNKDHVLENVRRMRLIQKKCQEKETEAAKPVKAMWKSDKYADIPSKLKQELGNALSSRPQSATFLRAHSRSGPLIKVVSRPCTPDTADRVSVPLALAANEVKMERHSIDFIKMNSRNAKLCMKERPPSARALSELQRKNENAMAEYKKGEVPAYLQHRQKQWRKEEEERVANTPDPSMPPGHRSLPDHERLDTLVLLQDKEKELIKELGALPIATDTVRVHTKRREVESKLVELEEAIRIFSRPKVFVKVDS